MSRPNARYEFASDNTAGICPEAWQALAEANSGEAASYGDDYWTARLSRQVRELFETDCEVFLVFNGTAANGLALAHLCQPFHSILCHRSAHLQTDECGAPEFFSGGAKLLLVDGANGQIDLGEAEAVLREQRELHSHKPRVLSLTQATELGTVYSREAIAAAAEFARERQMLLHMDGARFANAIASLGCTPKDLTWKLGIDALSWGGTKNGLAAGELVVFFRKELAAEFDYRAKQAGQLASKMRFLAAPWCALLQDNLWLRNAAKSNRAALILAEALRKAGEVEPVFPVEANAVFVRIAADTAARLEERGWHFYKYLEPDVYRFMCSWATKDDSIAEFLSDFKTAHQK